MAFIGTAYPACARSRGPHTSNSGVEFRARPTETEMPAYYVYLEDENGKLHPFDTEPIEAESEEESWKIVGGLL